MEKAKENGTTLSCGEYGVIDRADPEDALKWFKVINSVFVMRAFEELRYSKALFLFEN